MSIIAYGFFSVLVLLWLALVYLFIDKWSGHFRHEREMRELRRKEFEAIMSLRDRT